MIYCAGLELHALSSPTGTRYALELIQLMHSSTHSTVHSTAHSLLPLLSYCPC